MSRTGPVCIDAAPLDTSHRFRGIGTYVHGLLQGLASCRPDLPLVQLRLGCGPQGVGPGRTVRLRRPRWPRTRLRWVLGELLLPHALQALRAAVFHATDPRSLPRTNPGTALVPTVYDLVPLVFPRVYLHAFPPDERLWFGRTLRHYQRADHLIAISQATRDDVVRYLQVDPARISVIPLGYEAEVFRPVEAAAPAEYALPERYFLYAGAYEWRKNPEHLLRLYARIRHRVPEKLVLAGKPTPAESRILAAAIARHQLADDVRILGFVPGHVLPLLYARATAFVFPSIYEGFGFGPLEAMACGCPVVCSNTSSIPEVVGDAGLMFALEDEDGFADALESLAHDEALRARLRRRGLERSALFTWERCAQATVEVYRRFTG